jgi:hypothetical protein
VFEGDGLAVSIPARELAPVPLPGSLYAMDHLATADISPHLRRALQQIEARSAPSGNRPIFVARPELFTDGATLRWLRNKLGPIRDHVCLSDGSTIRLIPGMRNHVFFYALGRQDDFDALARLQGRAPELFSTLASQVNSALRVTHADRSYSPPTTVLHERTEPTQAAPAYFRFYFNRHATEDSVARVQNAALGASLTYKFATLVYVPLTETAMSDKHFMHLISTMIERSYFDPTGCIILGLPDAPRENVPVGARLTRLFSALQAVPGQIPRLVSDNVFIASEDVDPGHLRRCAGQGELLLHETFDFWRWAPQSYDGFDGVGIHVTGRRHQAATLSSLLKLAYGRTAQIVRHSCVG